MGGFRCINTGEPNSVRLLIDQNVDCVTVRDLYDLAGERVLSSCVSRAKQTGFCIELINAEHQQNK
jgi:hypothetical protein